MRVLVYMLGPLGLFIVPFGARVGASGPLFFNWGPLGSLYEILQIDVVQSQDGAQYSIEPSYTEGTPTIETISPSG